MASEIYHNNTLPLLRPSCLPLIPTTVASDYSTVEESSRCLEEGNVYSVYKRGRAPNWSDAETRFLLELWRDRFPLNKRRNSSAWVAIAKQLNKLLAKHCLSNFRSGPQCKARIKYLADEYKRVYNARKESNGNCNEREATFDYFEEMDAVLRGCMPNNTKSVVQISGSIQAAPSISSPIRSPAPAETESTPTNVARNSGSNEHPPLISPKTEFTEHVSDDEEEDDDDINDEVAAVTEPTISVPREERVTTTNVVARNAAGESSFAPSDLLKFLEESQKRNHEFFRMLMEREGERELQRQKMMFDMMKEVAKIFKGDTDTN